MAYGKGSSGFGPNVKVLSFNLKDKDLPAPQFEVALKTDQGYVPQETATRVSGDLIGVKHKVNQYQGKAITSVTATLRDGNDVYFVSIPYTYLGRGIMNSLCALRDFHGVEISVYKGKPKEPGKPGFSNAAVRQGGEMIYGKHEYKDLPPIPKVKVGSNVFGDSTAIDALFAREVGELDQRVRANAPVVANDQAAPETVAAPADGGDDSVPF